RKKIASDKKGIQIAEWAIARCKRALGENEGALEIQLRLSEADVYVCEERAILYALKEDTKELAVEFAKKALGKFAVGEVEEERMAVLRGIAGESA
ncbi:hypothetical protein HDU98_005564, partial [Podochytrium sp. JEL0797]